jgi:hypothetical protein
MRQCLVRRSRRVNAAPHRHTYGFSLVSRKIISYLEFVKSGLSCGVQTSSEVAGQMFCTLEAPSAMAACVGESVHMFAFMCFMFAGEMVGGVVGVQRVVAGLLACLTTLAALAPTNSNSKMDRQRGTPAKDTTERRGWADTAALRQLKRHAASNSVC